MSHDSIANPLRGDSPSRTYPSPDAKRGRTYTYARRKDDN